MLVVAAALFITLLGGSRALAHEIRPAIADLSFEGTGRYSISIILNLEALVAGIGPEHDDTSKSAQAPEYDRLRRLAPLDLRAAFETFEARFLDGVVFSADGTRVAPEILKVEIDPVGDTSLARRTRIIVGGALPVATTAVTWAWSKTFGASAIRVRGVKSKDYPKGKITYSAYLTGGKRSPPIPLAGATQETFGQVFARYVQIGFTHIVPKGLDHILFVVGLFLLSTRLKSLLWQVTGFTLAHSVTLALGVYGLVRVSPGIVEPLIAASIVYVCVENITTDRLRIWRPAVVFGFGLLHGLGFAGVLTEIGLARDQFITGLVAFNVGVELGQLGVIALCFAAVGLWFRDKIWYRTRITIPASLVIALVGAWWFIERTFLS